MRSLSPISSRTGSHVSVTVHYVAIGTFPLAAGQWEVLLEGVKQGVRLTFLDSGPGIANLELALTDGWTSGHGLGLGLSGARRVRRGSLPTPSRA